MRPTPTDDLSLRSQPARDDDDRALLAAIALGDLRALGSLFDRHANDLNRYVRRAAPRDDADDIVQDTFLRVARIAGGFDGRAPSARAWLFGIAHAIIRERRRSFSRWTRALAALTFARHAEPRAPTPGARADIERALERLTPDKREVVLLVEGFGMSGPEAAEVIGVPVGTVWTRLHHARRELREGVEGSR